MQLQARETAFTTLLTCTCHLDLMIMRICAYICISHAHAVHGTAVPVRGGAGPRVRIANKAGNLKFRLPLNYLEEVGLELQTYYQ